MGFLNLQLVGVGFSSFLFLFCSVLFFACPFLEPTTVMSGVPYRRARVVGTVSAQHTTATTLPRRDSFKASRKRKVAALVTETPFLCGFCMSIPPMIPPKRIPRPPMRASRQTTPRNMIPLDGAGGALWLCDLRRTGMSSRLSRQVPRHGGSNHLGPVRSTHRWVPCSANW
jgi:hypothetical protein